MSAKIRYLKLAERHAKGRDDPQRQKLLRNFVNEAMALIEDGLERDGVVRIHEFGSFQLKWHKERRGRNPQTGERITIPGQYRVMFKPAKHVEERVNWPYLHLKPELLESPSLQAPAPVPPPRLEKPASPATSPALPLVMPAPPAMPSSSPALVETFARPVRMPPAELAPSVPLRLDFAEAAEVKKQEKISTKEIPVGVVEDAPKTFAIPKKPFTVPRPPPPRRRRDSESKRIRWYASFLGILLLLLVLLLAKPISEWMAESPKISTPVEQPNVAASPLTAPAQPANGTSEIAAPAPVYPGGIHLVSEGDNLWGLSENYYLDPFLWPNIYRVNTDVVRDPDVLEPDELLTIPILHGRSANLTLDDRRNLAEGYFKVFEFYRTTKTHLAPYALWAAVKFDQTILEHYGYLITADEMAFLDAHNVGNMAAR